MNCPKINNKSFDLMRKSVGTKVAYNVFKANNDNYIEKAPNGARSMLFMQLLGVTESEPLAIYMKSQLMTKSFQKKIDWLNNASHNKPKELYSKPIQELRGRELQQLEHQEDLHNYRKREAGVMEVMNRLSSNINSISMEQFKSDYNYNPDKAIKDLNKKSSIYTFVNDSKEEFSGRSFLDTDLGIPIIEINLANMNSETPIHELLGHPLIRSIKQSNPKLYSNLKSELRKGEGLKMLNNVTSKYGPLVNDFYSSYDLEEEAIVHLLTKYVNGNIDKVKSKGLFGVLRELLLSMKKALRDMFSNKEIEIEMMPESLTVDDLANIVSFSNTRIKYPSRALLTHKEVASIDKYKERSKVARNDIMNKRYSSPMFMLAFDDSISKEDDLKQSLSRAKSLFNQNVDMKSIVKETGWVMIPYRNKWAFEYPGYMTNINTIKELDGKSIISLVDPMVSKLYKDTLKNITLKLDYNSTVGNGNYNHRSKVITIGLKKKDIFVSIGDVARKMNQAIFHEIQHAITHKSLIPVGSNVIKSIFTMVDKFSIQTKENYSTDEEVAHHFTHEEFNNMYYIKNTITDKFMHPNGFETVEGAYDWLKEVIYDLHYGYKNINSDDILSREIYETYISHIGESLSRTTQFRILNNDEDFNGSILNTMLYSTDLLYGTKEVGYEFKGVDNNGEPILSYVSIDENVGDLISQDQFMNVKLFKETVENEGKKYTPGFFKGGNVSSISRSLSEMTNKRININDEKPASITHSANGGLYVSNNKSIIPLMSKNEFNEDRGTISDSIPNLENNGNVYSLNSDVETVSDFISPITAAAKNNKILFPDDNSSAQFADKIMNTQKRKLGNIITKSLQTMFPDITFRTETASSTYTLTGRKDLDGWVDSNGIIHINVENFNPNTSIHELGHILEPLIARKHPQLYSNIQTEITKGIESGTGLYHSIYKAAQNKYDYMNSHSSIMSEVFAEGLASITMTNLNALFASDPTLFGIKETELNNIRNDFSPANEAASTIFSDIFPESKISTLEGIASMLASSIAYGGGPRIKFSKEETNFLGEFFKNKGAQYQLHDFSEEMSKFNTANTKGFLDFLRGNNFDKPDPEKLASNIASSLRANAEKGAKIVFYDSSNDSNHYFKNDISHEQLTQEILDIYVNPLIKFRDKLEGDIIDKYEPGDAGYSELDELLGEHTSPHVISKLRLTMGLDEPVDEMMRYSDLEKHKDPRIKKLYNSALKGYNPIVVIHGINDVNGDVSLSIVSMQPTKLQEGFRYVGGQNIFSSIMTDKEYNNKLPVKSSYVSKLRNSEVDLRLMGISLMVSHFKSVLGDNLKINKLGVINVTSNKFSSKMIIDIPAQMENLGIINSISEFMDQLEEGRLKESIKNGLEVDYSNTVNYMGLLKSHLLNMSSDSEGDVYFGYSADDLIEKLDNGNIEAKLIVLDSMRAATLKHLKDKDVTSDPIYMMIVKSSRELRTGRSVTYNDLQDMGEMASKFKTMYHMSNDYVQDVITATQEATQHIVRTSMSDIRALAGTTTKPGLARKIKNRIMKRDIGTGSTAFIGDVGSKLYSHLYKYEKIKLVKANGDFIKNSDGTYKYKKVKLPELHWDKNDSETKKAINDGIITEQDLEFNNKILDILETRYKDLIKHEHQKNIHVSKIKNIDITEEELNRKYNSYFPKRGMIPTVEISTSEMLLSGKFIDSAKKGYSQLAMSEALFEDVGVFDDTKDKQLQQMGGFFQTQLTEDKRFHKVGIMRANNGELGVFDEEMNDKASTDLWKTFNYLNQSLLRKVEYEKNVMPVAQDSIALLRQIGENKEANNIKLVQEFIERNAHRKNADDKKPTTFGKVKIDIPPIVRELKKAWNMAMLPGRVALGVLSTVFNTSAIITDSLSGMVENSNGALPPIKYFIKAAKESFTVKGAKKMRALALDYHIWGRSERELLTDPFINVSDHSIFNSMFGNIFNWASDTWARSLVMSAVMMKDGSYDAHQYDEKSGEIKYDENKDLRFYNKDGSKKTEPDALALYNGIKADVLKTLRLDTPPAKLPMGYGVTDMLYMKQLADTRIIGAFSDDVSALISNRWVGNLFMQYRSFLTVRAFNAGIFGNKLKTGVGQRIVPVKLKDGTWISKREIMDLEGAFQSFGALASGIEDISISGISKSYNNLNETQRLNIIRSILKFGFFVFSMAILMGIDDGDDDDDNYISTTLNVIASKWASDLLVMNSVLDLIENPFPSLSSTQEMIKKGELYKILPYYKAVDNTAEFINE